MKENSPKKKERRAVSRRLRIAGRVGDAAGTGICLLLADRKLALIAVTAVLFSPERTNGNSLPS